MTPEEARLYNRCPTILRPLLLIAGDVFYMLTLGKQWGHGPAAVPVPIPVPAPAHHVPRGPTVGDLCPDIGD